MTDENEKEAGGDPTSFNELTYEKPNSIAKMIKIIKGLIRINIFFLFFSRN